MLKFFIKYITIVSVCVLSLQAGLTERQEVATATNIIIKAHKSIPKNVLKNAKAIAVIPNLQYAGLILGATYGHGVLSIKNNNEWSEPCFVTFRSLNAGLRAGFTSSDIVLVFMNKRALDGITDGKATISISAGAAIVKNGSSKGIETDEKLSAKIYAFGKSSGLELNYATVSLGNLYVDDDTNDKYYDSVVKTDNLLEGYTKSDNIQSADFVKTIMEYTK